MIYIVELKNGTKINVGVIDGMKFFRALQAAIIPGVKDNFFAEGGYMFNISEIAAIYPTTELIQEETSKT